MASNALQTTLDLQALLDLAGIYRTWNSKYNNWSVFGQDHVARVLLKYPEAQTHDAVGDALKSICLYNLSRQLQQDPAAWQQAQVNLELNQFVFHHMAAFTAHVPTSGVGLMCSVHACYSEQGLALIVKLANLYCGCSQPSLFLPRPRIMHVIKILHYVFCSWQNEFVESTSHFGDASRQVLHNCRSSYWPIRQSHRLQRSIHHMKGVAWVIAKHVYVVHHS